MQIIEQSWEWSREPDGLQMLRDIELAGRTCYKSEDKITEESAKDFVGRMIQSGHHAMIEFAVPPPVKVITDRGVTHEIVRHRLFAFAQESTRYCNYWKNKFGNEITVILPVWFLSEHNDDWNGVTGTPRKQEYLRWKKACVEAQAAYMQLIKNFKASPQEARSVLPNSLKAEINISGNVREWRHFFKLRCSNAAHPQMRELARDMLKGFQRDIPVIFDNIT